MKSTTLITKIIEWILRGLQLQLFLTIFSLPFLCAWGIPLSLLSPLGNMLFGPALTLFLLLSSLIFLTELIGIPNNLFITCLEQITYSWLYVMHANTKQWLIGFAQPSYYLLYLLPISALFIMMCKQTQSLYRSIICLLLLLVGFWAYAWHIQRTHPHHISIPCNKGALHLIHHEGALTLIDPGYMGKTISAPSWVQYTLVPLIIKHTGRVTLDHVIVLQPTTMTLKAVESLMIKMPINQLYIPYWHGNMSYSGLFVYRELKQQCKTSNTTLTRFGSHAHQIPLSSTTTLTITPLPNSIRTGSCKYPAFALHTFIDNKPVTLYSAKYPTNKLRPNPGEPRLTIKDT